jgi:hypothetical protein
MCRRLSATDLFEKTMTTNATERLVEVRYDDERVTALMNSYAREALQRDAESGHCVPSINNFDQSNSGVSLSFAEPWQCR